MTSPALGASATAYDSLVVGGGPSGLACALQLARFNRRVALFDSGMGRSTYHQINRNYLGFPGGVHARELRDLGRAQVREYQVACVDEGVVGAERSGECFVVHTASGRHFIGKTVVFATGVRDRFPLFPDWEDYVGRSVFWCIVCDGYSTRGKRVVVVGNDTDGGVTALQFTAFTSDITVVTNSDDCGLSEQVQDALRRHNIDVRVSSILGVRGDDGIINDLLLADGSRMELDYLFSLQGSVPNSEVAASLGVAINQAGYVLTDDEQHTNIPGVFAAGDLTKAFAHQVSTAVHEGNTAATTANYFLYGQELRHETYEKHG